MNSMKILLENVSKKYNKEYIFRNVNFQFQKGEKYAIKGSNGSGKSTLLKLISGFITPTSGKVIYEDKTVEEVYNQFAFCTPYQELIEEMTLSELLVFHQSFKKLLPEVDTDFIVNLLNFDKQKLIKDYSSGMKQRVKLALAFFSDVPVLLLDEPSTNLDAKGVAWYLNLVDNFAQNRTLIIASNIEREYSFCEQFLEIEDFKS